MIVFGKTETVLDWWRTFPMEVQKIFVEKYFPGKNFLLLSSINIEEMYDIETTKKKKKTKVKK